MKKALAKRLHNTSVDVLDIGTSGTEEVYFATSYLGVDGGIDVSVNHNPINYNGMKLIREGALPISSDYSLYNIQRLAEANNFQFVDSTKRGSYKQITVREHCSVSSI